MPPAFVQNVGEANSKSSSATLVITTGVAAALGNCVLVAVGGLTQSTDISSCADSRGNTYTRLGGASYDLGVGRSAIFASILTTALQVGDTITATWASAVSTRVMAAIEVSGITSLTLDGSTPITIEAAASASMSNGPTATTTNADDFLWAMWLVSNGTATFDLTPDSPWVESQLATTGITGTNRSIGTQYRIVSATGAYTATATQDASRAYDGVLVALPGATAGTTVTVPAPATATAAGIAPAVTGDANITAPSPATATAAALVPTVTADNNVTITVPDPATATAAALAPAVVFDSTITVPSAATATASALVPTVTAESPVSITIIVPAPATATASVPIPVASAVVPPPVPPWKFVLANSSDLSPITELARATNRNLKLVLNRPGQASFDMALDYPEAEEVKPIKTCILAYQDNALRWSGPVWTISEDVAGNKMSVTAVGWFELLNHRYLVADAPPDTSTVGIVNSTFATDLTGWTAVDMEFLWDTNMVRAPGAGSDGTNGFLAAIDNLDASRVAFWGKCTGTLVQNQIYRVSFWAMQTNGYAEYYNTGMSVFVTFGVNNSDDQIVFQHAGLTDTWTQYTFEYVKREAGTVSPSANYSDWEDGIGFGIYFHASSMLDEYIYVDTVSITKVATLQTGYRYYEDIAADDIAYLLLETLNEENPSESLPVAVGTSVGAAPPFNNPPRTRTYKRYTNVGQAIQELSDIENGFDFEVDPATRALNLYHSLVGGTIHGKGSTKSDVRFGYLTGPDNLSSFSRQLDGQIVSNDTIVTGKNGAGRAVELASITTAGTAFWAGVSGGLGYRIQDVISLSDVPDLEILQAFAGVETTLRSFPRQTYNFVPRPYSTGQKTLRPFVDYGLGDIVYVSADRGRVNVTNQAVRIFGFDIAIDENGVERVTNISTSPSS
jgi:hypothetical protein